MYFVRKTLCRGTESNFFYCSNIEHNEYSASDVQSSCHRIKARHSQAVRHASRDGTCMGLERLLIKHVDVSS